MSQQQTPKYKPGMTLHHWIASGGKPEDYESCKGLNSNTVTGYTGRKAEEKSESKKDEAAENY